jgi:hypothetical protein
MGCTICSSGVAIELSQKTWLVTLHSPDRDRINTHHKAKNCFVTGYGGSILAVKQRYVDSAA